MQTLFDMQPNLAALHIVKNPGVPELNFLFLLNSLAGVQDRELFSFRVRVCKEHFERDLLSGAARLKRAQLFQDQSALVGQATLVRLRIEQEFSGQLHPRKVRTE